MLQFKVPCNTLVSANVRDRLGTVILSSGGYSVPRSEMKQPVAIASQGVPSGSQDSLDDSAKVIALGTTSEGPTECQCPAEQPSH